MSIKKNKNKREEQAGHGEKHKRRLLHTINNYVSPSLTPAWFLFFSWAVDESCTHSRRKQSCTRKITILEPHNLVHPPTRSSSPHEASTVTLATGTKKVCSNPRPPHGKPGSYPISHLIPSHTSLTNTRINLQPTGLHFLVPENPSWPRPSTDSPKNNKYWTVDCIT